MGISSEQEHFISIFSSPQLLLGYTSKEWESLLRIMRGTDMLGSFYYFLQKHNLITSVPDFALMHLQSAKNHSDQQVQQVNRETDFLHELLQGIGIRPIFLKGAAYVLAACGNHNGRVMSDLDILVNKSELQKVESALISDGWSEKKLDDYDEQYYRKWIHELPPFINYERGVTLDVHHTIIPPISGITIPEETLFSDSHITPSSKAVFNDEMLVIHSIIHLFFNEEHEKSFRDIYDIQLLLESYEQKKCISHLYTKAQALGFNRELFYALTVTDSLFNSARIVHLQKKSKTFKVSGVQKWFVLRIIVPAVIPSHELLDRPWNRFARFVMFLRGHLLKMPIKVLLPHFFIKSYRALVFMVVGAYYYSK